MSSASSDPVGSPLVGSPLDPEIESVTSIGVDSGSTLVKVCALDDDGRRHLATWLSPAQEQVLSMLRRLRPARIGLTGCGTREIAAALDQPAAEMLEFDAWGQGANLLLHESGQIQALPYLLVSIGTGTSLLRVEGDRVDRVGGTALGGGTVLGLGLALTDCRSHDELAELASRGQRGQIDLLVSDIYQTAEIPLAAAVTASSFGKLARNLSNSNALSSSEPSARKQPANEDLAAATMGLVAENIVLLCTAHAREHEIGTIVYGGSTLAQNPALVETISLLTKLLGFEVIMLPQSGHAGAIGAMLMAR